MDDNEALVDYIALQSAWVPLEMHLFAQGRHAFALGYSDEWWSIPGRSAAQPTYPDRYQIQDGVF